MLLNSVSKYVDYVSLLLLCTMQHLLLQLFAPDLLHAFSDQPLVLQTELT